VPEGRGVPEPSTSTQKWAAAARDLQQRVSAAHAKAWLAICLFLLLQMGRHPFPMLLAEPSFFVLSAVATFLLQRVRVKQSNSSSLTSSVPPSSSAIIITALGSKCSSQTGNCVTMFDNRCQSQLCGYHPALSHTGIRQWLLAVFKSIQVGGLGPPGRSTIQSPK